MAVSERKHSANRANSKKSTGPTSAAGKKRTSNNAVKHGVYAVRRLIDGEDGVLYDAIKKEQASRFAPTTYVEKALVDQLVGDLWTLRRISRAEKGLFKTIRGDLEESAQETPLGEFLKTRLVSHSEAGDGVPEVPKPDSIGVAEIFENLFLVQEKQNSFERLMAFKRQILNNILSLEKELERRKST